MAVASPALAGRPVRDDVVNPRSSPLASTGYVPGGAEAFEAARARARNADKDAETMAGDSPLLGLGGMYATDSEETTRAVSREELMRHQDAHVIVGRDAVGDDATLALAPGMLDEALGASTEQGGTGGIGAALAEVLQPPVPPVPPHPGPPAFPPPPQFQQPPPWGAPQAFDAAFDPMLPQGRGGPPMGGGGYPSSGQQQVYGGPNPQQATAPGPPSQGQFAMQQGQQGMQAMQPMQPQPGQQPMWMPQPSGPPAGVGGLSRFTPQVILLVAVGAVCLAIFIIGIVLFVTTKF